MIFNLFNGEYVLFIYSLGEKGTSGGCCLRRALGDDEIRSVLRSYVGYNVGWPRCDIARNEPDLRVTRDHLLASVIMTRAVACGIYA